MYQPVFKFALYNALSWVEWCCDCLTGLLILDFVRYLL